MVFDWFLMVFDGFYLLLLLVFDFFVVIGGPTSGQWIVARPGYRNPGLVLFPGYPWAP